MLDPQPSRRKSLELYVDAGPLARDVGYAAGRVRPPEIPLLLFAGVIVGGVLTGYDDATPGADGLWASSHWSQLLFGVVGAAVVITGLCWSGPVRGRLGWLLPPILRVIEYGFVIRTTTVVAPDLTWLAYVYLAVVAYHHTDTIARLRHLGLGPARWVYTAGLGYDGRMLVVAALALAGPDTFRIGLLILVGVLALVYVLESGITWVRWWRDQPRTSKRSAGRHRTTVDEVAEWAAASRP